MNPEIRKKNRNYHFRYTTKMAGKLEPDCGEFSTIKNWFCWDLARGMK